jgi:prepilin-type N-terminal cleavage/methylation domain-containing protein
MKKAFTLVELILVVVIVGIISAVMVPRLNRSTLDEAAHQIVTHIRYTQHLALMDDKYDPNDATWYKTRWQLFFSQGSNHKWAYTVFSDFKGTHTGNPDATEIAKNPIDTKKYLTGGLSSSGLIHYDDQRATKELNLADKYGVTNV